MIILKHSPHKSFRLTQLVESVAICEALGSDAAALAERDRFGWGNGTDTEPAFLVYLGCSEAEISGYLKTINTFYRCQWCEIRKPKYLKEYEAEIKIRGMQRYSDSSAFGLDYLIESESAKHMGCDLDEYNYYTTGYMPRW